MDDSWMDTSLMLLLIVGLQNNQGKYLGLLILFKEGTWTDLISAIIVCP